MASSSARGRTPTPEDLAIVADFARHLAAKGNTEKENTMQGDIYVAEDENGQWFVAVEGRHDTQASAIAVGRFLATVAQRELIIHGEDGQIREKDSHGNDPKEIKG
jgi:hypothetical protein